MGKNEKTPIIIDDVEYQYEDMTDEQKTLSTLLIKNSAGTTLKTLYGAGA